MNKIKVLYYLRPESKDEQGYMGLRGMARFHGIRFNFSPAERVMPAQTVGTGRSRREVALWEPKTCRVLPDHPRAREINKELQAWEDKIVKAFEQLSAPNGHTQVTRQMMEEVIFPATAPAVVAAVVDPLRLTLGAHYEEWKREYTGLYSKNTLRRYKQVVGQLEKWRPGLTAADITEANVRDFLKFMLELNFADANIAVYYKFFRMVRDRVGQPSKVAWLKYAAKSIAQLGLEADELRALIMVRLTEPRLQEERDRWLLQCFAGRRYEDIEQLNANQLEHFTAGGETIPMLRHGQGKTGSEALAPLPPIAVAIGERWGWQFPPAQNYDRNEWIKQVAKTAGLSRLFNDATVSGGKYTDNYRPVHDVMTTHTARHTCAELLTEGSDEDTALAKFVLGHADEGVTDRYAKTKVRKMAPKVLAAWRAMLGELYDGTPTW